MKHFICAGLLLFATQAVAKTVEISEDQALPNEIKSIAEKSNEISLEALFKGNKSALKGGVLESEIRGSNMVEGLLEDQMIALAYDIEGADQTDVDSLTKLQTRHRSSYYDWGLARNGFGYCYLWAPGRRPLNEGRPVSNYHCERVRPSYHNWGLARNGFGYCYQQTPQGYYLNEGRPVSNHHCERYSRSYFDWAQARNGHYYCYQWTPQRYVLNDGRPVSNHYCN